VPLGTVNRIGFVFRDDGEAQIVLAAEPWKNVEDKGFSRARVG
jgi:hypothetical protein